MKKILAILMSFVIALSCGVPAFAYETDIDRNIEFTIDNPFGDPVEIGIGCFNRGVITTKGHYDLSDIPTIRINGTFIDWYLKDFVDTLFDILWWEYIVVFWAQINAFIMQTAQIVLHGAEYKTDEASGVTVLYDKMRFGNNTDGITLRVSEVNDNNRNQYEDQKFTVRCVNDESVTYEYAIEFLNAEGVLTPGTSGGHPIRVFFNLPDDAPLGLYEISCGLGNYYVLDVDGQVSCII